MENREFQERIGQQRFYGVKQLTIGIFQANDNRANSLEKIWNFVDKSEKLDVWLGILLNS